MMSEGLQSDVSADASSQQVPLAPRRNIEEARNIAIIRGGFDRWIRGNGSVFDLLSPDARWIIMGSSPSAGVYDRTQLDAFLKPFNANLTTSLVPTVRKLYAEGDEVIALFDATAPRKCGQTYKNSYAWFLTMRKEMIIEVIAFLDLAAFDAVLNDQ